MTNNIEVMRLEEMTPEKVAEHIEDSTWGEVVEEFINKCLEDSDTQSLKLAYALNSMFVQTTELGVLFAQAQSDIIEFYQHARELRNAFAAKDIMNPALIAYDNWMNGTGMFNG